MSEVATVWVFHGDGAMFASGVFATREDGLAWVEQHALTGILTEYPLGIGAFDDAVARGRFISTREHHGSAQHVERFSPAYEHLHVLAGRLNG